jgi:NADH:ubiquinone oxidoreductase subunit E
MSVERVHEIIDAYDASRTASLAVLQDIQREYNYLPREALELTAERLGMPLGEVYSMATFFKAFSLQPKGEHICKVCLGTACHVGGGPRILEQLERDLGIEAGDTTPDGLFSVEAVRCVGACALSPVVILDDQIHGNMTGAKASKLISPLRETEAPPGPEKPSA